MLFLARERNTEADDTSNGQHSSTSHRDTDQTFLLHAFVYLTLKLYDNLHGIYVFKGGIKG